MLFMPKTGGRDCMRASDIIHLVGVVKRHSAAGMQSDELFTADLRGNLVLECIKTALMRFQDTTVLYVRSHEFAKMNVPAPPQEASHERRRRQNRESQRRWRERYRQEKAGNKKKSQDTPSNANETPHSGTPSITGMQSPSQSTGSSDSQQLSDYFVENTNLLQDQLAGRLDSHISWPPEDFHFPPHPQSSTSGYLNGSNEAPTQPSLGYITSPRVREQFSHFSSVGMCGTTPAPLCAAGSSKVSQSALYDAQRRDIEAASTAEESIRDVQMLYRVGVAAGFLKRDDKIKNYLAGMRRTYRKVPILMDEDFEAPSWSDLDEWSD